MRSSRMVLQAAGLFCPKDDPTGDASIYCALPGWDLRDLYDQPDGAAMDADFAALDRRIAAFEIHRGKIADIDSATFGKAIAE